MRTQTITDLDPANWKAVYPPAPNFRARRVQVVNAVDLLFKATVADPTITIYAGAPNIFESDYRSLLVAFYLKPLSGSPEPGLIWG